MTKLPDDKPADGPADDTDGQQPSYEEARDQLVEVVRVLEQGGTSLAESLALWEKGEQLARVCQDALEGARARLDEVIGATGDDAGE
ncbi:MAG: exodeoxyribonuclease VII small subunit [Marmoricola sp.]